MLCGPDGRQPQGVPAGLTCSSPARGHQVSSVSLALGTDTDTTLMTKLNHVRMSVTDTVVCECVCLSLQRQRGQALRAGVGRGVASVPSWQPQGEDAH